MAKFYYSLFICMTILILQGVLPHAHAVSKEPVTISARNNALTAAVRFLSAQKECKIEEIQKYSIPLLNNESDADSRACQEKALQNAEVTDYIIVSSDLALVSTKLDFQDKVVVQTSPVVKIEGKWKIVVGINDHHPFSTTEEVKPEILEAINGYLSSIKTANKEGIETFGKQINENEEKKEGLLEGGESSSFHYKVEGIKMVADTVAIASISTKVNEKVSEQKYVVYLEDTNWKVISDRYLVNASIPKNANPVKIK